MLLIALDPAPTNTGIVSLWLDERAWPHPDRASPIVDAETLSALEAMRWLERRLAELGQGAHVVIEKPPRAARTSTIESEQTGGAFWMLYWAAKDAQVGITVLTPGSWKPAVKGWQPTYPGSLTDRHQRDAYGMLLVVTTGKARHALLPRSTL